jgi:hypothetical protein
MYDQTGDANYNPAPQVIEAVAAAPAPSIRYVATTGADTGDCGNSASPCGTIKYALSQAVAGNTIEIASGTYTEAGILVDKELTIIGAGATSTIVQAATTQSAATDRVLYLQSSGQIGQDSAIIERLTIQNGNTVEGGGGIYNNGFRLILNDSFISNNSAMSGGGISNITTKGMVTLNNSTVSGNSALDCGGGIYSAGNMTLNNSTVSGNSALDCGGGIYGNVTLNYSTVANNTSDSDGDGSGYGGGIYQAGKGASISLQAGIVAGNKKGTSGITDATADCNGTITSQGYNLTGTGTGCDLSGPGDVTVTPANVFTDILGTLANNGGATQTHALIVSLSNPALNAIPTGTNDCSVAPFDLDQRGEARPFNTSCDMGAYEAQSVPPTTIDQTITLIRHAPSDAVNGSTFPVEAFASSGLPVSYSSSGSCTNVGADFTMTSGTGTCTVMYDQAGDAAYNPAPQVVEYVTALKPVPSLNALSPGSARAGSADMTLNIAGGGFAPDAVVRWHDGATTTNLSTTYVSESELSAVVPAALLANPGTFEVSVFNPAPGGGTSASLPFFVTQSAATVTSSDTATSTDPSGTAVASTGGSGEGTPGSVTASASGTGTATVAIYDSNPRSDSPFKVSTGGFFDVYVAQGSNFSSLTIVACNMPGFARIRWLDGGTWRLVNPQSYSNGCVTMNLSSTSSPTLAQLTGTIFGVEGYEFIGFLSPVDNPETVNMGKAGRTYPIKWQLKDGDGLYVSDLAVVFSITHKQTSCGAFSGDPTDSIEVESTGGTGLRYDSTSNQYIYNWKTPASPACYTLFVKFNTGQVFHAYFILK